MILQLWIITWPVIWLTTLRWEVLSARWSCKLEGSGSPERPLIDPGWLVVQDDAPRRIERRSGEAEAVHKERKIRLVRSQGTAVTATEWLDAWRMAIIAAAEGRKQQTLTSADRLAARAVEERISQRRMGHTSDEEQGGFLGAASGLIRGVSDVLRDAEMARGWGGDM